MSSDDVEVLRKYLDIKFEAMDARFEALEERVERLENNFVDAVDLFRNGGQGND